MEKQIKKELEEMGILSAEELDGAYIKASKENKILFLTKLVTAVG